MIECQACKEIAVIVVNTYMEGDRAWDEMECQNCKAYSQMSHVVEDYDPSPDTQEEVTRIGGWG